MFKKTKDVHESLVIGDSYAVTTGTYVGEIFIYVKQVENNYCFLSIPKMLNREVPQDKFEYAKTHKVIEFLEKIPRDERVMCELQYNQNEK
ncbi:hypothetical protein N9033_00310 [bacterium]|nr:hypothetical protein [bacterium]